MHLMLTNISARQVYSLAEQNRFYKKAAGYCLRAVAKHSPELAQAVIDSGALDSLVTCLEEFDPGVKEAATWCLGYIAGHNTELAQQVVDAGMTLFQVTSRYVLSLLQYLQKEKFLDA